jgi:TRAP-type C4-dicarboxylate transport system permease small subunit
MKTIIRTLFALDKVIVRAIKYLTVTIFIGLSLLMTANIVVRYLAVFLQNKGIMVPSFHWFDEIVEMLFSALVFYGSAGLWIHRGHYCVGDWISKFLPGYRSKYGYRLFVEILCFAFLAIFFWASLQLTLRANDVTNAFQIPKWILYSCMPISAGIMCLYSLRNIAAEIAGIADPEKAKELDKNKICSSHGDEV